MPGAASRARLAAHALPLLRRRPASLVLAEPARVALGDEIGQLLRARLVLVLVLLGERPGLPDKTRYVSNIRPAVLPYPLLSFLLQEARRQQLALRGWPEGRVGVARRPAWLPTAEPGVKKLWLLLKKYSS